MDFHHAVGDCRLFFDDFDAAFLDVPVDFDAGGVDAFLVAWAISGPTPSPKINVTLYMGTSPCRRKNALFQNLSDGSTSDRAISRTVKWQVKVEGRVKLAFPMPFTGQSLAQTGRLGRRDIPLTPELRRGSMCHHCKCRRDGSRGRSGGLRENRF